MSQPTSTFQGSSSHLNMVIVSPTSTSPSSLSKQNSAVSIETTYLPLKQPSSMLEVTVAHSERSTNELSIVEPERKTYREQLSQTRIYDYSEEGKSDKIYRKSILYDLMKYDIREDVKHEADKIFSELNATLKSIQRIKAIIICLYEAYRVKIPGAPKTIKKIAEMVGYRGKLTRCNAAMYYRGSRYRRPSKIHDARDYITEYLRHFSIDESQSIEIRSIADYVIEKDIEEDEILADKRPTIVAIALIKYYFNIHGIKYDQTVMIDLVDRQIATIDDVCSIIKRLDNE